MEYLPIVHLLNTQNPKCVSERKKSAFLSAEHSERRGYLSRKRASQTTILDTIVNALSITLHQTRALCWLV